MTQTTCAPHQEPDELSDEALQLVVNHWAAQMGLEPPRAILGSWLTMPHLKPGRLYVGRQLATAPADQRDVIICHELAHLPQMPERRAVRRRAHRIILLLLMAWGLVGALVMSQSQSLDAQLLGQPLYAWILLALVILFVMDMRYWLAGPRQRFREHEHSCDLEAVRVTGHWDAFCEVMRGFARSHRDKKKPHGVHPSPHQRVRYVAEQLQLPVPKWAA